MIFECKEVSTLDETRIGALIYTSDQAFADSFKALPLCPFKDNPQAGWTHLVTKVDEPGEESFQPGRKEWIVETMKEMQKEAKAASTKKKKAAKLKA